MRSLIEVTQWIREKMQSDDAAARGAASQYLRLFALTIIACLWSQIIVTIRGKDGAFYDVKRKLARFYVQQVLPETIALAASIVDGETALAEFTVADFSNSIGDY